jgi:Flp pilus assembly protein TadD
LNENKLDAADKNIQTALRLNPDDDYNLAMAGKIKFAQDKYDAAQDYLSRAAAIAPKNPETQNYLGLTLSRKGLRPQAEAAFRKAVEMYPDYAPAQNNLAAFYLTETPPLPQLALWHYRKAVAAGQPRNTDLEKMLTEKGAPYSP